MRKSVFGTIIALAIVAVAPARAEVSSVVIGIQNGVAYIPLQVVASQHLVEKHAKKLGITLTASVRNLGSAGLVRDALIAGQIQFGVAGPPTLVTMHDKTRGDIKAIGAVVSVPIYLNTTNKALKTVCDFKEGDKIALPTVKSSVQAVTLQMATKKYCNDPFKADRFTVSMPHPDGYNALMSGMVSTHMTSPPFSYDELEQGKGKVHLLLNSYDLLNAPGTLVYLLASQRFRDANPKVYQAVRAAFEEGEKFAREHPKEAAQIYVNFEHPKESLADVVKELGNGEIIYNSTPIALGAYADFMYQIGTVKKRYTWQELSMPELRSRKGS